MKEIKYKPVVFRDGRSPYHSHNVYQQALLLKALTVTQNPEELKTMIGVKTVAEVYRTLDKLSLRKEYHEVLGKKGVTIENVVGKLKSLLESQNEKIQLGAAKTLLQSLGLDKYEQTEDEGKNWEEVLLMAQKREREGEMLHIEIGDYEVTQPEIPDSVKKRKEEEGEIGRELYA